MLRLPHSAEPGIRILSVPILRVTEDVPPDVLFTTNSSASTELIFYQRNPEAYKFQEAVDFRSEINCLQIEPGKRDDKIISFNFRSISFTYLYKFIFNLI